VLGSLVVPLIAADAFLLSSATVCACTRTRRPPARHHSVLQFKGPIWGLKKGVWYGVEFHDGPHGRNDGSYDVRGHPTSHFRGLSHGA
jgi:hypothetical protein